MTWVTHAVMDRRGQGIKFIPYEDRPVLQKGTTWLGYVNLSSGQRYITIAARGRGYTDRDFDLLIAAYKGSLEQA